MNKAEEFLKGKMDDFNTRHLLDQLDPIYQGVLIGLLEQYAQQRYDEAFFDGVESVRQSLIPNHQNQER